MTSAKNTHPSSLSRIVPIGMTNSSDEASVHQNQQHELIRLLTQHLNQLATTRSATTIGNNQPLTLPLNPNGAAIDSFQSRLAHYQQQLEQPHYRTNPGQGAINFSTQNRTTTSLDQPTGLNYLSSAVRPMRNQPTTTLSSISPIGIGSPVVANKPPIPVAPTPTNCNPFLNDMSLFSALNCFGLPNDQFVLSLQQQYLIQTANAARQLDSRFDCSDITNAGGAGLNTIQTEQSPYDAHRQDNIQQRHHISKYLANGTLAELGNEMIQNQSGARGFLKFGINTILGRGSPPVSGSTMADEHIPLTPPINTMTNEDGNPVVQRNKFAKGRFESAVSNEQPISPECDPDTMTDIDSESSPTPQPQNDLAAGAQATNLTRLPTNHQRHQTSASNSTNNQRVLTPAGALTAGGDAQHTNQQQQQQHPSLSFLSGSAPFPWTVASRGKPRRGMMRRAVFSDSQRVGLEKRFQLQKYISKPDRKKLAEKLGLRDSQVKIWFQNRRMKWRNSKERELLSAGGSREQTLPTRNNPNPDLSDVGESFKRFVSGPNSLGTV